MGEWPNNLRSQLTWLQNNDEAGAVLGKKHYLNPINHKSSQSLEIDCVKRPKEKSE